MTPSIKINIGVAQYNAEEKTEDLIFIPYRATGKRNPSAQLGKPDKSVITLQKTQ
jgi:hypothetical protein